MYCWELLMRVLFLLLLIFAAGVRRRGKTMPRQTKSGKQQPLSQGKEEAEGEGKEEAEGEGEAGAPPAQ